MTRLPNTARVYDRDEYDREKRAAREAWGARLDEILRAQNNIPLSLASAS
jgi:hypothetical protein